jgi:hypothetical protein
MGNVKAVDNVTYHYHFIKKKPKAYAHCGFPHKKITAKSPYEALQDPPGGFGLSFGFKY